MILGVNWLDILYFVVFLGMLFKGSHAGVGSQIVSLVWIMVLVFVSIGYFSGVSKTIFPFFVQTWARAISFFVITACLLALMKFLDMILKVETSDEFSPLERAVGSLLAGVRTCVFFGIISIQLLLVPISFFHKAVAEDSRTAMFFVGMDSAIYTWMASKVDFLEEKAVDHVVDDLEESADV